LKAFARHYSLRPQLALRASFAVRSGILPPQSSEGWNPVFQQIELDPSLRWDDGLFRGLAF
jgi:hypothetical protein